MKVDVIIVGAGAAGMMCAIQAGRRGRTVLLLDHAKKLAEKIRISGGGRCNFTNLHVKPENYVSENPHFCRSALARFGPHDFLAMLQPHNIAWEEKTLGQLFCSESAESIITLLRNECEAVGVKRIMDCVIDDINYSAEPDEEKPPKFHLVTSRGEFTAHALVVATGGLSIPRMGATPYGYKVAEQFGIPIVKPRPGLVPLTVAPDQWQDFAELTGVSIDVVVSCEKQSFREQMLVTHRGLSGPAILQISSYWRHGRALSINLLPDQELYSLLQENKTSKKLLSNFLTSWLPKNFSDAWCNRLAEGNNPLNQYNDKQRKQIAEQLHNWQLMPSGTMGYSKAEVTCGGVDTHAISSKTMECIEVPGLYFIGEVLDVTGQLGGYNFQWAWASGYVAGQAV